MSDSQSYTFLLSVEQEPTLKLKKSKTYLIPPPGLQTSQDAHFYSSSARFEPFSNQGKTLVIQFTVKHEQNIDCGGGYIKLFPADLDQADMHGDSKYNIMFGKVHYQ